MSEVVTIQLATPTRWQAQHFWMARRNRSFGVVLAFCPSTLAIGGELFGSADTARGAAVFIGPLWLGFATLRKRVIPSPTSPQTLASELNKDRSGQHGVEVE